MADVIKVAGLSREQVRRLDRLAKRADRTRSSYVRGLILGAIETEGMANDRVVGQGAPAVKLQPPGPIVDVQPSAPSHAEIDHTLEPRVGRRPLIGTYDPDSVT